MIRKTVLITVLLLTACSHVTSGTVIDKRHEDQRIYYEDMPRYQAVPNMRCDAKGYCTTTYTSQLVGWDAQQRIDDEDWVLVLQDGDDRGEVEVDRETYDRMEVGSYYGEGEW